MRKRDRAVVMVSSQDKPSQVELSRKEFERGKIDY